MLRKILMSVMALSFIFVSVGAAYSDEGPAGNKRKGKYSYRKVYKACFERGDVDSVKPLLNPDSKTQAEWATTFEDKDFAQFQCGEEWNNLSETALLDIYTYLWNFAADSPTPAKCK